MSLLRRMWICLVLRRKDWRTARAASHLTSWAWNTGQGELWGQLNKLQSDLWDDLIGPNQDGTCCPYERSQHERSTLHLRAAAAA